MTTVADRQQYSNPVRFLVQIESYHAGNITSVLVLQDPPERSSRQRGEGLPHDKCPELGMQIRANMVRNTPKTWNGQSLIYPRPYPDSRNGCLHDWVGSCLYVRGRERQGRGTEQRDALQGHDREMHTNCLELLRAVNALPKTKPICQSY